MSEHLSFEEAIDRVKAALCFGIDLTLETTQAILAELGHPEQSYRCLQVAGTNGKTSTSRYTAALLRASGFSCGLYTSPHLVSYVERVEVDGAPVSEEAFAEGVAYALKAWERVQAKSAEMARLGCTEFELLTAAACVMFAAAQIDVAVLEVGLGGKWDATSAIATSASAVTGIGLDHTHILGDTLDKIACEKAAVIHAGNPCVLGTNAARPPAVLSVMLSRCAQVGVVPTVVVAAGEDVAPAAQWLPRSTYTVRHEPAHLGDELVLDVDLTVRVLAGTAGEGRAAEAGTGVLYREVAARYKGLSLITPSYQAQNIACALALACGVLGKPVEDAAARAALASCPTPGRFEVIRANPLALLDACHNPQSCQAFASAVEDAAPERSERPCALVAALADKDHAGIASIVAPLFDHIVVTQSDSPRALPAEKLAEEIRACCAPDTEVRVIPDLREALDILAQTPFVACGTITLIGQVKGLLLN